MTLSLSSASDAELVALALSQHEAAFRELLARHRDAVFRLARASTGDADEAMDITQDVFVSAFAALSRFDTGRPFRAWLSGIALNKCRDWARRRKVRSFFTRAMPLDQAQLVSDDAPLPDQVAADRMALRKVQTAISALPTNLRETLVLRTIEGLSQAEAAEILGLSEKVIETRLYRARAKLKEVL